MGYQISPAVTVTETDLSNIIPAVSSSTGAAVFASSWGPVQDVTTVDSENTLVRLFGKPNTNNAADWFSAANFLSYSGNLLAVRVDTVNQRNAVVSPTGSITSINVTAGGSGYDSLGTTVSVSPPNLSGGVQALAHAVVAAGAVTAVVIDEPGSGYTSTPAVAFNNAPSGTGTGAALTAVTTTVGAKINNKNTYDVGFSSGNSVYGQFAAKYPGSIGNSLTISMADSASFGSWAYKAYFQSAPGTSDNVAAAGATDDELHVIVIDRIGSWTGTAGAVLETFPFLSKVRGAKNSDGITSYYAQVLNDQSAYVYWLAHPTATVNWGTAPAAGVQYSLLTAGAGSYDLTSGVDDFVTTDSIKEIAFALFDNAETYDVDLIVTGSVSRNVAEYVIANVAETRLDCVAFVSPVDIATGQPIIGNTPDIINRIIAFKNGDGGSNASLSSSSYVVFDSGYKYQYDQYNDTYRWVPLNGDIAGLCARTDYTNDPWFSPAGYNRGQIKNVVKLAYNPRKTDRDNLYLNGINPVVSFPGQGVVLFGDKTGLAKPSAFDRINVRRLFIVLEKAIATAAKYQLFEFNDAYTQANFRNQVEPFLRDVQGRRGLYAYNVQCDSTNNTPQVIDSNQFVATIWLQPTKSINFIALNFVATNTGVSFTVTNSNGSSVAQ